MIKDYFIFCFLVALFDLVPTCMQFSMHMSAHLVFINMVWGGGARHMYTRYGSTQMGLTHLGM